MLLGLQRRGHYSERNAALTLLSQATKLASTVFLGWPRRSSGSTCTLFHTAVSGARAIKLATPPVVRGRKAFDEVKLVPVYVDFP